MLKDTTIIRLRLSRSCLRGSGTPAFRAGVRGWLGDLMVQLADTVLRRSFLTQSEASL
jgi:hypothetical protein